jgi:hypothetical protein
MDELQGQPSLRALSIGEIFDRAVTMYVRHFAVFSLTVLTLLVPFGFIEFFVNDSSTDFSQFLQQMAHPGAVPSLPPQFGVILLLIFALLFLTPFTNNAVAVGVAAIYAGRTPTYRDGFARVLRRWGPLVGSTLLCGLIVLGAYFALVVAVMIVAMLATLLFETARFFGVVFAVIAVALFLVALLFFMLLIMCVAFALYATTLEDASPADAIGEAFRRIFNRREIGKATLISLAYLAIQIGAAVIALTVAALVLSFAHSTALQLALSTAINAAVTAFATILLAVYYYDVRTRSEGLDLEVDLERLTAPT